jgi:hypothetical protein
VHSSNSNIDIVKIPLVGGNCVYAGAVFLLAGMVAVQLGLGDAGHVIEVAKYHGRPALGEGPGNPNLTCLSYWDQRSNAWCHVLWLFEQAVPFPLRIVTLLAMFYVT